MMSTAINAQGYVHPSLSGEDEVCLFLSSPENDVRYTLYGEGGDYSGGTNSPGDAFVLQGQQYDGTYLYKWERPTGATGTPQTITIYKNGSGVNNRIYTDKPFVNHGLYREITEEQTVNATSLTKTLAGNTEVELKDGSKITLTVGSDHDFYFESPLDRTFNCWMYYKNYSATGNDFDQFLNATGWPGDALTKLGQLSNGNYLYRGVQVKELDVTPTSLIINYKKDDGQYWQCDEVAFAVHGYYTNSITTKTVTSVSQYGKAYATPGETTSSLDPLAVLTSQNEVSLFLEAPAKAKYTAWLWDGKHEDGYFNDNKSWPGDSLVAVGTLANGHYLYKWTQDSHINDIPTNIIICKNGSDDSNKIYTGDFNNHGYLQETTVDNKPSLSYNKESVTRMTDGSYATNRTTYGKRVIYEMNIGSFTQEGTFASAQQQLSNVKNLGVDVVWLMPVYERGKSKSPYAVKDFKSVNHSYGTLDDLKNFVTAAHLLGMDVWLDFVPNHAAVDNAWADPNSSNFHPEYFTGYKKDNPKDTTGFIHPNGYNDVYQLDYTSEDETNPDDVHNPVGRAIEDAMKYWLNETDIDGFRFDYVSSPTIPDAFWNSTLNDLKTIKPSIQFLAEADFTRDKNVSPAYFQYDYAWDFNDHLRAFGTSTNTYQDISTDNPEDKPVDLAHITKNFLTSIEGVNCAPVLYLTNHDKNWNETEKTLKGIWGDNRYAMTVLEFTLPGMPLIYNGQEQDGTVALNYFNDDKIQWTSTSDKNMLGLIQELAHLKHTNNALNDGSNGSLRGETHILNTYNHNVLAIERKKGDEHVIAVINLAATEMSSNILGATSGTWKKVLQGNNIKLDNLNEDVDITDNWQLEGIPAHGYEIFTYNGESNKYSEGMYFVTDDSWNNPTMHRMLPTGSDDNYNYFRYEIKGTDFDALNTPENGTKPANFDDPLYFKFQEYYDFLNIGTICKTDLMFAGTSADKIQFKDGGAKSYPVSKGSNDAPAFNIVRTADNVAKYIITFARSKAHPDEGVVSLEIVKTGDVQTGFYLLTPSNINSQETLVRHQWRFDYDYENPDAVGDKYMKELNEDKKALCSYTIDAKQFDSYIPSDRKSGNAIQFRIRQYDVMAGKTDPSDNEYDVDPASDDKGNDNSTFDASKGDKVYANAHWDKFADNDAYFKIVYQPDVAKYIIQLWQTGSGSDGATRVRVYYVKKFNYQGSTIEDVAASGEDVYLYNVDAQKFLYVGNNWGTMASLLYDDLGTRMNISDGKTDENPDYKLIKTRLDAVTTVPNGHMLGIDDFRYNKASTDKQYTLDEGNIYCDRNNGNRWIFEKADSVGYANTYTMKLFDTKDGRFHLVLADHSDANDPESKVANTKVKYYAEDFKTITAKDDLDNTNLNGTARKNYNRITYIGEGNNYIGYTYDAPVAGTYIVAVNYLTRQDRNLTVTVNGTDYVQKAVNNGTYDNINRATALQYSVHLDKGENTILIGKQTDAAPNITQFSIAMSRLDNLAYARWQLVTYSDLVDKLKNENAELYGGTSADATFLLRDQGFTRNIKKEDSWNTDNGYNGSTVDFTKNTIGDVQDNGMYWNARLTGKGCVFQNVNVPMYGVYQFDAYGFYNGSPTQMYYQYAKELNADGSVKTWSEMLGNTPLVNDKNQTYNGKSSDIATGQLFYNESVLGDNPAHLNTQFIYVPQDAATNSNGEYRIRIGFNKTADAQTDYTAVDDIHLHYTGKAPFIINDDWTQTQLDSALENDNRENVPIWIKREFWANKWNAVVFPVSVSTTTLRAMFGDGVEVASPYGLDDDDPYLIRFNPISLTSGSNAIEAGKFYIVRPNKLVGTSHVMNLIKNDDNTYTPEDKKVVNPEGYDIKYYSLGSHNISDVKKLVEPLDVNSIDFHAGSKNDKSGHNTIRFEGSYTMTEAPARSYVFASDGRMYHLFTAHQLNGFRFYIVDVDKPDGTSSKSVKLGSLAKDLDAVLASFDDGGKGEPTGIHGVTTDSGNDANGADSYVYDLSGRRVAAHGETDNLPGGVYIINGRKFVKK